VGKGEDSAMHLFDLIPAQFCIAVVGIATADGNRRICGVGLDCT
jgi:hypothetical protein